MSALRISRRGYETVFVDLGPAQAHIAGFSGSLVVGTPNVKAIMPTTTIARRAQMVEYRANAKHTCRKPTATGTLCARTIDHRDRCYDAETMTNRALGRRLQ